jgi:hypothetical protein
MKESCFITSQGSPTASVVLVEIGLEQVLVIPERRLPRAYTLGA